MTVETIEQNTTELIAENERLIKKIQRIEMAGGELFKVLSSIKSCCITCTVCAACAAKDVVPKWEKRHGNE